MTATALIDAETIAHQVVRELAPFAVRPAEPGEAAQARAFAATLIGAGIASADDLARVQRRSGGASLFVTREDGRLTGVMAFVLLNAAGHSAVRNGGFDTLAPADAHIAGPREPAMAFYGWGVAAATKPSARRLVDGGQAIMAGAIGHLPKFTRPTTEAGHRLVCERMGFVALPGSRDGLVWRPALAPALAA